MTRKVAFIIGLALSLALAFATSFFTKLTLQGYAITIDVSDAIVFLCAIVVGPWGAVASAVGTALGDLASGLGLQSLFSFITCIVQGIACALAYKYAFKEKKIMTCKILSVLIGVLAGALCVLAIQVFTVADISIALVGFVAKTVAKVICGAVIVLIMPKVPHYFDEERFMADIENEQN